MKTLNRIVLLAVLPFLSLSLNAQVTWEGDVDNDWETNGNWDSGLVPDYTEDIIIPVTANDPVIQSPQGLPVECNSLTIDAGVTLTIQNDGALNVFAGIDNSGNIVITGNGTLWQDFGTTYTGQVGSTFSLSRTGTSDPLKFNMFSSPVAAQNVSAFSGNAYNFNPATSTASPADDDNDPGWTTAAGNMTPGKGYAGAGCGTVTFSGIPNNGNLSVPVFYHGGPGVPYNLIGNPYPSPLDIYDFLNSGSNPTDLAALAVYMWDNAAIEPWDQSDYATVNMIGFVGTVSNGNGTHSTPYNVIPTGQGFFIEIDPGTDGDLDFNNSQRGDGFDDNSQFYKQGDLQRIWLGVSDKDSTVYNEILVAFTDSATTGFDKKYDAKKLVGNTRLSMYSINNNRNYAIQGLPYLKEQEVEVPLGLSLDSSNTITFALKWEEELQDFDLYLKDMQTSSLSDLRNDNYTLQIPSGAHNTRFSIVMTPKNATGISLLSQKDLTITQSDGVLRIGNPENELQVLEKIVIFDLNGKRLKLWNTLTLEANGTISLPFEPGNSGHYVVNVVTAEKTIQQKVRIIK